MTVQVPDLSTLEKAHTFALTTKLALYRAVSQVPLVLKPNVLRLADLANVAHILLNDVKVGAIQPNSRSQIASLSYQVLSGYGIRVGGCPVADVFPEVVSDFEEAHLLNSLNAVLQIPNLNLREISWYQLQLFFAAACEGFLHHSTSSDNENLMPGDWAGAGGNIYANGTILSRSYQDDWDPTLFSITLAGNMNAATAPYDLTFEVAA